MTIAHGPKELRDVERTFVQAVMFELGIIPMEKPSYDMRRALEQLEPDEARKVRRKFRKMWRRTAARYSKEILGPKLGKGKKNPSRAERNARKQLVFNELWTTVIEPMVKRFDNAGKDVTERPVEKTPTKKASKSP